MQYVRLVRAFLGRPVPLEVDQTPGKWLCDACVAKSIRDLVVGGTCMAAERNYSRLSGNACSDSESVSVKPWCIATYAHYL